MNPIAPNFSSLSATSLYIRRGHVRAIRRLTATALMLSASTVGIASDSLMFPTPTNAIDPSHVVISPGASEQDYFWLKETNPGSSAIDHYSRVFAKWKPCRESESGWSTFGDRANGRDERVHQLTRYWVSTQNDTAVTVLLKYASPGATTTRPTPASDRQFVAVVRIKVPDAKATLAGMGIACE